MAIPTQSAYAGVTPLADLATERELALVATATLALSADGVAFDDYVFELDALTDGATVLERGIDATGAILAVASVPWPEMPMEWTALQSRDGDNLLGLTDEMEPVGHDDFDHAFAVDADDPSAFRRGFRSSLREWFVAFDAEHGPLTIVFDAHPVARTIVDDDDEPDDDTVDAEAADDDEPDGDTADDAAEAVVGGEAGTIVEERPGSAIYVARSVLSDDALVGTLSIATTFADRCRDEVR